MSRSPMRLGDPLGHPGAEVGEVEPVAAAVEDALGVVDLAVAEQVDDRLHQVAVLPVAGAAAAARAAAGSASRTVCTARSSWAADTNHASYADGRQVDAAVEHGVEERRERSGVLAAGAGEVADLAVGEEDGEHGARRLDDVGHPGAGQRVDGRGALIVVGGLAEVGVDARRSPAAAW